MAVPARPEPARPEPARPEAAGPERVTPAEQIEVSVREAQAGVLPAGRVVPNDTGRWAAKVDRLAVEPRDGVRGTNVAGRG